MDRSCFSTMARTTHEKYTHYPGDGGGRDHHVLYNNGGLTKISNYPTRRENYQMFQFDNSKNRNGVKPFVFERLTRPS